MSKNPTTRISIRRFATAVLAAGAAAAVLPLATVDSAAAAGGPTTYYFAPDGNDSNSGTSPDSPWKSIAKTEQIVLAPGDKVLLKRGGTYRGKLGIWRGGSAAKRLTVGAYGPSRAAKPVVTNSVDDFCVMIGASNVTVQDIKVQTCRVGVWVRGTDNLITRIEATDNIHGIEVDAGSKRTKVLRNYLHHNDRMFSNTPGEFDDSGATGVVLVGDDSEVAYNKITDNWAPSEDFGTDGSAVEIYGGIGSVVHHNISRNNRTFTELGNNRSADTTFAYNVATSNLRDSEFLITRGGNDYFGPVRGTVAANNTVKLTGANSRGFVCYAGCTPELFAMYNNIFDVAGFIGNLEGTRAGGNNIYWRGNMWSVTLLPGDRVVDPNFNGPRLAIGRKSPAVDSGLSKARFNRDARGRKVGVDGNGDGKRGRDIGAYEAKKKNKKAKNKGKRNSGKGKAIFIAS
ncbi:hypothetical protein [Nocardioides sp.]|uniref:hypothetical protein n=1 Tax=Nocardioides sp. TaxID=35761 RepID=UPI003569C475